MAIGEDEQPTDQWPTYVVADTTHRRRIADPSRPSRVARLFQVYLIREADWLLFDMPPYVRRMLEGDEGSALLTNESQFGHFSLGRCLVDNLVSSRANCDLPH